MTLTPSLLSSSIHAHLARVLWVFEHDPIWILHHNDRMRAELREMQLKVIQLHDLLAAMEHRRQETKTR